MQVKKKHCQCAEKLQERKPTQPKNMLSSCPACKEVLNRSPPNAPTPAQPVMLRHLPFLLLTIVCACGYTHTTARTAASSSAEALDASANVADTGSGQAPSRSSTRGLPPGSRRPGQRARITTGVGAVGLVAVPQFKDSGPCGTSSIATKTPSACIGVRFNDAALQARREERLGGHALDRDGEVGRHSSGSKLAALRSASPRDGTSSVPCPLRSARPWR